MHYRLSYGPILWRISLRFPLPRRLLLMWSWHTSSQHNALYKLSRLFRAITPERKRGWWWNPYHSLAFILEALSRLWNRKENPQSLREWDMMLELGKVGVVRMYRPKVQRRRNGTQSVNNYAEFHIRPGEWMTKLPQNGKLWLLKTSKPSVLM